MWRIFGVVIGAVLTCSAHAQEADFAAQMRDVNAEVDLPEHQTITADAIATLQAIAREKSTCIPTGVDLEKPTPATAVRLAVQGIQSGQLKNAWMTYGHALGCPDTPRIRLVILLMSSGEVRVRQVNQGESIASMSLMRDTSPSAAIGALTAIKAVNPDCDGKGMTMIGTKVLSRSPDLSPDFYGARYRGSWKESWTFEMCGHRADVPVSFTADGKGGAYSSIKPAEIRVLD